ncbi:hypothetical protein [Maribacter halichondriae]|uniref:hypothetical protein n=1 Tax=Maribacter halichondriae TaxID=2980554 RepID=UPI0023591C0C|nr:hypothetical protein [Maribacter sp. Hal144]
MDKTLHILAVILLIFLGVTSILGGLGLMGDPTGAAIGIPAKLLESTIFDNYLLPGIILFLSNGISSLVIAFFVVKKASKYSVLIVLQGIVLLGWLAVELLINLGFFYAPLHITYYLVGIALIVLGTWLGVVNPKQQIDMR